MILIYGYYQLNVNTKEVKKQKLPQPKSLEQAALMCMKLNQEAKVYGAVYFLTQDSEVKSKWQN